jgi:hypothetical protein
MYKQVQSLHGNMNDGEIFASGTEDTALLIKKKASH